MTSPATISDDAIIRILDQHVANGWVITSVALDRLGSSEIGIMSPEGLAAKLEANTRVYLHARTLMSDKLGPSK